VSGDECDAARPEIAAWLESVDKLHDAERRLREVQAVAAAELVLLEAQLP
jgi:hypothetical protein